MAKRLLLGCGLPLLLVVILGVYIGRSVLKPKPKVEHNESAQRGDVEIKVVETGTIEPLKKVEVKSKVGGRVLKLFVDEGATVSQGQVLALIDPKEINNQVLSIRAQLASSKAKLAEAQKNAAYQRLQTTTGIDQYLQNAEAAKAHLAQLEQESGVQSKLTRQTIDIAQANLDAAAANLNAQKESLNLLVNSTHPNAVAAAQSAYDQAIANTDNDRRSLKRQRQLLAKGFIAQQVVDAAETQSQVSEAHLREVKERLDRIKQTNAAEEANARAQVASAAGQMRQMEVALDQAKTSVLPATKRSELQNARATYRQALAQVASARSVHKQDLMRLDEITGAEADVQNIQHQLNLQLVAQNDTTLVAEMPGMITKRYVEQGDLISSAISTFSSGQAVYQISDLGTLLVKINVNEVDIAKVKHSLLTEVGIDAARGVTFLGRVRKVAPAALTDASASSGSQQVGTTQTVIRFPVEIQIDHADRRLKPGMSAKCTIVVARHRNVVRIPANCIQGEGAQGTVQIVTTVQKDGHPTETTTPRPVTVGLRGDDFVEITSGLNAGDKVRPNAYTGPPRKTIKMNDQ